jgi:hypothetical protein
VPGRGKALKVTTDIKEEYYIGRKCGRNGRRDSPKYAIASWNVYERTIAGLHRTNNSSEGFNNAVSSSMGCSQPTFFKTNGLKFVQNIAHNLNFSINK